MDWSEDHLFVLHKVSPLPAKAEIRDTSQAISKHQCLTAVGYFEGASSSSSFNIWFSENRTARDKLLLPLTRCVVQFVEVGRILVIAAQKSSVGVLR